MDTAATYCVYILASRRHGTLYIGVTRNIPTRLNLHRSGRARSSSKSTAFTCWSTWKSSLHQEAIAREKQLKNWHRDWKIRLIEENNPDWSDLSDLL